MSDNHININGNSAPVSVTVNNNVGNNARREVELANPTWFFWVLLVMTPVIIVVWSMHPALGILLSIATFVALVESPQLNKVDDRKREQEKLSVRAEVENELFLKGDPRGTYGHFPPAE